MTRTAKELAQYLGVRLEGDPKAEISGVASPERAGKTDLIYVDSHKHLDRAAKSNATCMLAARGLRVEGKTSLETDNPKFAFVKSAEWLRPKVEVEGKVHETAILGSNVVMGANVSIGPYVVIEDDVAIGDQTKIDAFCFLGRGARVGTRCRLHPRVTLYSGARIGDRVELHSGAVIGGDGFGYVFGEGRHWKFPQMGSVEVGSDAEIGCNTTVDRGSLGETRIGQGVKIDNLVQVGHNVQIGDHSVLAAQVGISGSSVLGDYVTVGGQAGMGEHCMIEDRATVGGQSGVLGGKRIRAGEIVWGTPARKLEKFKQQYARFGHLEDLADRVRELEHAIGERGAGKI